jgi:predicted permease
MAAEAGMVIGRILGIFCIIFIGFGANKIGWLPAESGRALSRIVLNIAAPCVVVNAMSSQDLAGGDLGTIVLLLGIGAVQFAAVISLSFPLARLLGPAAGDRGVYRNFLSFSNSGYMGFPVAYAVFGQLGMFYMVIVNCVFNVFIFTFGIWNVRPAGGRARGLRGVARDIVNPVIISLFVGFFLLLMQIRLPQAVTDVLDSVGSMMAPLSMIVIGLQLTESRLGEVIRNGRLIAMSAIRLVGLGGICFLALLPFYMRGMLDPLVVGVLTLNLVLPCAAVPVMFAEEYGANARLAAEGTFLSTLFSIATIPVCGVLLAML